MKKLVFLAAAFAFMSYGQANAQNFLNKMKQKAENAVNQQINRVTGNKSDNSSSQPKVDITDQPSGDNTTITTTVVTDFEYENREVDYNNFDVDLDNVKPASGNTYEQLLAQLPALPSAAQIANPTEAEYQNYLKKLQAVKLKADMIMEDGCAGDMPAIQQPQIPAQNHGNPMASLTREEMMLMAKEGETIEKEIAAQEKKLGRKMTDIEQFHFTRKNHKEFTKIALKMNEAQNGVSAAEMEKLLADIDAASKAKGRDLTQAEMDELAKSKYPALYAKANAASKKQQQAMDAANQRMNDAEATKESMRKLQELDKKYARDEESARNECYQFAAQYESQLRDIYSQIVNSNDKAQISQLYAKADGMVNDYRQNAAKSWVNGITTHINAIKASIPEYMTLYKSQGDCIKEHCKLGQLQKIIEDMEDAYGAFPPISVEPVQVSKTNITCYRAESVFYPKVTGFMANSRLSKSGEDYCDKFSCDKVKPAYGTYKSADGKRQVVFSKDGSLTLPGGYVHYPVAFEQQGDNLVWYEVSSNNTIMEYKYKL